MVIAREQSTNTKESRAVGVHDEDTNDYHLYVTNLPDESTSWQVRSLHELKWNPELLVRKLKSLYRLEKFQANDSRNVKLLVEAALADIDAQQSFARYISRTVI